MQDSHYLQDVLIILLAAVLVVPIFKRLRSSPVLGYLVAGALIGPHGLAVISDIEGTMGLAHFGVVFLLFAIGLELSVQRLRTIRTHVFMLGGLQIFITSATLFGIARAVGIGTEAAIVVGGGLALSSTAMVLQILVERQELASRQGRIAFAILLLQDLSVVPLLALIPLLGHSNAGIAEALALASLKAFGALAVILIAGRLVLRPVLRIVADVQSPELFTGITLLVALGVSYLTELAGLSMALGAFLAGLLIAETEYRHQVEGDIEPFRGILLALFFMTVGMTINIDLVMENAVLVILAVVGLTACKAGILILLCRAFRFSMPVSIQVGLGLAQGGEFAFVLFGLATATGVLPTDEGQIALVTVALTMALTPVLMELGRHLARMLIPVPGRAALQRIEEEASDLKDHIIIAGFGRVGQTLAQLLDACRVPYLALDLDPNRVNDGREHGLPVHFGDGRRYEVMKAAGVERARAAVITLDHPNAAERSVTALRRHCPELSIFVRARDHSQGVVLEKAGANHVVPELVESSLYLGGTLLREIGHPADDVARLLDQFRKEAYRPRPLTDSPPPDARNSERRRII
jgi:CPA2 family monovalent cation:H+ antiporter-2